MPSAFQFRPGKWNPKKVYGGMMSPHRIPFALSPGWKTGPVWLACPPALIDAPADAISTVIIT
jgi:hypothetical protein